jgi:hypothetical protein
MAVTCFKIFTRHSPKRKTKQANKQTNELRGLSKTIPTERPPLVGDVSANFVDRGCQMVSVTDPYGRNLGFLDRSRYFSSKLLLSCIHEAEWTPYSPKRSSGKRRNTSAQSLPSSRLEPGISRVRQ